MERRAACPLTKRTSGSTTPIAAAPCRLPPRRRRLSGLRLLRTGAGRLRNSIGLVCVLRCRFSGRWRGLQRDSRDLCNCGCHCPRHLRLLRSCKNRPDHLRRRHSLVKVANNDSSRGTKRHVETQTAQESKARTPKNRGEPRRLSPQKEQEDRSRHQVGECLVGWNYNPIGEDLGEDVLVQVYDDGRSTGLGFTLQLKSTTKLKSSSSSRSTHTPTRWRSRTCATGEDSIPHVFHPRLGCRGQAWGLGRCAGGDPSSRRGKPEVAAASEGQCTSARREQAECGVR